MTIQPSIANKLTPQQLVFFERLSNYVDKKLYFYGSITRCDYFPGRSDIDVALFSENEESTMYQICALLNVKKHQFKKFVYRIDDVVVHGFKLRYADPSHEIETEISVYNDRFKRNVLYDQEQKAYLPLYATLILYIVKVLFYDLRIISKKAYKRVKQFLMTRDNEVNFIEL